MCTHESDLNFLRHGEYAKEWPHGHTRLPNLPVAPPAGVGLVSASDPVVGERVSVMEWGGRAASPWGGCRFRKLPGASCRRPESPAVNSEAQE